MKTYAGISTDGHGISSCQRTRGFRILYYSITYYCSRKSSVKVAGIGSVDTATTKECFVSANVRIAQLKAYGNILEIHVICSNVGC
jgi:hypothetical protein